MLVMLGAITVVVFTISLFNLTADTARPLDFCVRANSLKVVRQVCKVHTLDQFQR